MEIIIFTSQNCAPCGQLKQKLKDNEEWLQQHNITDIYFIDMSNPNLSDEDLALATKYSVRSSPTIIVPLLNRLSHLSAKSFEELQEIILECGDTEYLLKGVF